MNKRYISVFVLILTVVFTFCSFSVLAFEDSEEQTADDYYGESAEAVVEEPECRAKVIEVFKDELTGTEFADVTLPIREVSVIVKVLEGARKGEELPAVMSIQILSDSRLNEQEPPEPGDIVYVSFTVDKEGIVQNGVITDYVRQTPIIIVGVLLLLLLFAVGGLKSLKSILALLLTCLGVIFGMIPLIYNGVNPVIASIVTCIFVIVVTLLIVYGRTMKTLGAAMGAAGGVIASGILSWVMITFMHITGIGDCDASTLVYTENGGNLNLSGILLGAVIISSLGGTIDVSISIASALSELKEKAKRLSAGEMMASGINIGVDILGASLNTLILAYVGGAVYLLMLYYANSLNVIDIINSEQMASEIIRALAGTFGLLLTVPITSFVCAKMMCKNGFKKDDWRLFIPKIFIFENKKEKSPKKAKYTLKSGDADRINKKINKDYEA